MLGFVLASLLALIASGAPIASAGPAQEEYRLNLPSATGGGGGGSSTSTSGDLHSQLLSGAVSPSGSSGSGSTTPYSSTLGGPASPSSTGGQAGSKGDEALLAKARQGVPGSGLLSAGASAAGKTPMGLAVIAALLLITIAGVLAARRRRRVGLIPGAD